ncbi:BUD32 family EKC/KEOPS complex subunit [Neisseria chenwenguii]|uniref:Serine/threonine protein phosphatase n=1 Tax=Neisseria chenwenguii TaxID=1853278 RepID=A0A220RZ41_9NEIS|nr:hypothetical protein BG910_00400 [Neisseria chenwenguii]
MNHFTAIQKTGIKRYALPGGRIVWVRKAGAHNAAWKYTLMGMVTKPLHLGALKPVPSLGGVRALDIEVRRLKDLASRGINVPALLLRRPDAIMISGLEGRQLDSRIEKEAEEGRLNAWRAGLAAIADVHAKGGYLSQAFARNMLVSDGKIGFIDFEDDPGEFLSDTECQTRDWLCYLHSTSLTLRKQHLLGEAAAYWGKMLADMPPEVRDTVVRTVKPIRWMHVLKRRFWGRDTLRLAALADLFLMTEGAGQSPPCRPSENKDWHKH